MTDDEDKLHRELARKKWWEGRRRNNPGLTDEELTAQNRAWAKKNTGAKAPLKNNPELARQLGKKGSESRWQSKGTKE